MKSTPVAYSVSSPTPKPNMTQRPFVISFFGVHPNTLHMPAGVCWPQAQQAQPQITGKGYRHYRDCRVSCMLHPATGLCREYHQAAQRLLPLCTAAWQHATPHAAAVQPRSLGLHSILFAGLTPEELTHLLGLLSLKLYCHTLCWPAAARQRRSMRTTN